jgi:hypothetical protein
MNEEFVAALTDETIDAASGADLRKMATDAGLSRHDTHESVLSVNLRAEVISTPGALAAVGQVIEVLAAAYKGAGCDPVIDTSYGSSAEIRVWQDDSGVRRSLKWARERSIKN